MYGTIDDTSAHIVLPHDFDTSAANLVFSINGSGLYATAPAVDPNTERLVSGALAYAHGSENFTTLTYFVKDSDCNYLTDYETYTIYVTKLPVPLSPAPVRSPMIVKAESKEDTEIRDVQDPFGQVNYLPNSHYILGRITNNGTAVNPDYIVAAYVGEELRGKQQVVYHNNMSYIPILVSTVIAGEPLTFKIWKDGSTVKTFDNSLVTIPGGRTGNPGAYYQFNMATLDANDTVEPIYVTELGKAYPNPFNPTTTIDFSLKEKQDVTLSISISRDKS